MLAPGRAVLEQTAYDLGSRRGYLSDGTDGCRGTQASIGIHPLLSRLQGASPSPPPNRGADSPQGNCRPADVRAHKGSEFPTLTHVSFVPLKPRALSERTARS